MTTINNIEFAEGRWCPGVKRHALAYVTPAIELASEGLEAESVRGSAFDSLRFRIFAASKTYPSVAEWDARGIVDLMFPIRALRHRKLDTLFEELPGVVYHEGLHAERNDRFPIRTLAEMAVAEGICFLWQRDFNLQLTGSTLTNPADAAPELGIYEYRKLLEEMKQTGYFDVELDGTEADLINYWIEDGSGGRKSDMPSPGEILAINAVADLRVQGASLAEVIQLSPVEILEQAA